MTKKRDVQKKYTRQLIRRLRVAHNNEPLAVIVRAKDADGLERPKRYSGQDLHSIVSSEQEHSQQAMGDLVEFVHRLEEEEGNQVKLVGTSWLTNSMLLIATPSTLNKLAARDDVAQLDVNAEMGEVQVSSFG